jgi:hypothetical protein
MLHSIKSLNKFAVSNPKFNLILIKSVTLDVKTYAVGATETQIPLRDIKD